MGNMNVASRLMSCLRYTIVSMGILSIAACDPPGKLTAVVITNGETCTNGVCGTPILDPVRIEVRGEGVCPEFKVDFGYGAFPLVERNVDFKNGPKVYEQIYFSSGWPGPKRIVAEGVSNCVGRVTTEHRVFTVPGSTRENLTIAIANPTQLCYGVPSAAPRTALRKNTIVTVTSPASPKINYGCAFNGCIYDANGKPGSSATGNFPFLGLREYSLVLKVGNQAVQGGSSTTFTTTDSGDLLLCFNDNNTYDNGGGLQVDITIDERNAAPIQ